MKINEAVYVFIYNELIFEAQRCIATILNLFTHGFFRRRHRIRIQGTAK